VGLLLRQLLPEVNLLKRPPLLAAVLAAAASPADGLGDRQLLLLLLLRQEDCSAAALSLAAVRDVDSSLLSQLLLALLYSPLPLLL
jgi:hypothetical protein